MHQKLNFLLKTINTIQHWALVIEFWTRAFKRTKSSKIQQTNPKKENNPKRKIIPKGK